MNPSLAAVANERCAVTAIFNAGPIAFREVTARALHG